MSRLDEIGSILFGNDPDSPQSNQQTVIFYATALSDSEDGEVELLIDDPIYSLSDEDTSGYEFVTLDGTDDDAESIGDDDDIDEEEYEVVYWDSENDEATEGDDS